MKKWMMNTMLVVGGLIATQKVDAQYGGIRQAKEVKQMLSFGWTKDSSVKTPNIIDTAIRQRAIVVNKKDTLLLTTCKPEDADGQVIFGRKADGMLDIQVWDKDMFYHLAETPQRLSDAYVIPVVVTKPNAKTKPITDWIYRY